MRYSYHPRVTVEVVKAESVDSLPSYQSERASGMDLRAAETVTIPAGKSAVVSTGIKVGIPAGYEGQVRSRSGLAATSMVFVLNSPGTVDSDYRGEVRVILANLGDSPYTVKQGDRIAQLVISPVFQADFQLTLEAELSQTSRGNGGLGSTGR